MLAAWEIHATDPKKTVDFYAGPLGWSVTEADWGGVPYFIIVTSNGQPDGRVIKRHGGAPEKGAAVMGGVLSFSVDDIDAAISAFADKDAVEAMPKFELPGEGFAAYFLDPDNNVFGLFEGAA